MKYEEILSKTSQEDLNLIEKISDKAWKYYSKKNVPLDDISLEMDLVSAHNTTKLDLNKLLEFDDFNFLHDISGIMKNLDRDKLELKNCFLPRCSKGTKND